MSSDPVRLAPDARLFLLGEEGVVFSEATQTLHRFNTAATCLWIHAESGADLAGLAAELAALMRCPVPVAETLVAETAAEWRRLGLLAGSPVEAAESPDRAALGAAAAQAMDRVPAGTVVAELRYRLLDTTIAVRYRDPIAQSRVAPLFEHLALPAPGAADVVVDIDREGETFRHFRDAIPVAAGLELRMLAPSVMADLATAAVRRQDFLLMIHAAVLGDGERAVLLPAAAGSGKTTLSAALAHAGFEFGSDEVALLARGARSVRGLPLPMCIKQPSWALLQARYPLLADLPTHVRGDGKIVRYLPPPAARPPVSASRPLAAIVFPRYAAGAATELQPLSRAETLQRLLNECRAAGDRLSHRDIADLLAALVDLPCAALTVNELGAAVEHLARFAFRNPRRLAVSTVFT